MQKRIGFIGAGNMTEAIIKGMISKQLINAQNIFASDINKQRLDYIAAEYNINAIESNNELVSNSDVIVIAIKPQNAQEVLEKLSIEKDKIFVSIMAGKTINFIKNIIGQDIKFIRIMPNMPALLGQGVSAITRDENISDEDFDIIRDIFACVGDVVEVTEDKMDIVTAVSGSGPAYVYLLAELMISAGVKNGLTEDEVNLLVKQTFVGASKMLKQSDCSPKELREKVTSKGGTTEAALNVFFENNIQEIVEKAVESAKNRSIELN